MESTYETQVETDWTVQFDPMKPKLKPPGRCRLL